MCSYHQFFKMKKQGNSRNLLVMMDMFIILFVVIMSQVYASVQTH